MFLTFAQYCQVASGMTVPQYIPTVVQDVSGLLISFPSVSFSKVHVLTIFKRYSIPLLSTPIIFYHNKKRGHQWRTTNSNGPNGVQMTCLLT